MKNIKKSLSLASCSLLQLNHAGAASFLDALSGTEVDTAVLFYSEADGRVSLIEPVIKLKTELDEDEFLSVQLVFDTLTGATPNGAQTSSVAQTFTSPSGKEEYTIDAGDYPLDNTFRDSRLSITTTLEKPVDRLRKNTYGVTLSAEHDWSSVGGSYTYSEDFNQRNTTFTTGVGFTLDAMNPTGGAPIGLAPMQGIGDSSSKEGNQDRTTFELMAGITQVLSRSTLTQLNFSLSQSDGYHNDPYKVLSIIDDNSVSPTYGEPNGTYLYESRPDSRQRYTIFWNTAHHLTEDVIHFSYRYYQDDWDIQSHTLDLKYRYELSANDFLQPHIRYYTQTQADFYRHSLHASETLPAFASSDYRLAEFNSITVGIKYERKLANNHTFGARLEIMEQTGDSSPADAIGDEVNHDLYPGLTATMLQFNYSFIW